MVTWPMRISYAFSYRMKTTSIINTPLIAFLIYVDIFKVVFLKMLMRRKIPPDSFIISIHCFFSQIGHSGLIVAKPGHVMFWPANPCSKSLRLYRPQRVDRSALWFNIYSVRSITDGRWFVMYHADFVTEVHGRDILVNCNGGKPPSCFLHLHAVVVAVAPPRPNREV